ncbi:hypothetical protein ABEB36_007593 [Hypothenemus hampei]|uniref:Major facilitator superfamily (MFS) profile domain-containing protein n=1 Tax=Hypothenemus hampei TaxID=57062 RepID=A0ABD1EXL6_HYPHA
MEEKLRQKTKTLTQYFAGFLVSMTGFAGGSVLTWTSPGLLHITKSQEDQPIKPLGKSPGFLVSTFEEALIGAMPMLGALIFAIPSGKCVNRFGRKPMLTFINSFYFLNYLLIAYASNAAMVIIGRFCGGLALGANGVVVPMYIAEIAEPHLKGTLGSFFSLCITIGIFYTNLIGIYTDWFWLAFWIDAVIFIITIATLFLPESPRYLIIKEKISKARKALMFYRGTEEVVAKELISMQKQLSETEDCVGFKELFTRKCYRKRLIASGGVLIYQQFCGINILAFYFLPLVEASGKVIGLATVVIFINVLNTILAIGISLIIHKQKRKNCLLLSGLMMFVGIIGTGAFFNFQDENVNFPGLFLFPLLSGILVIGGFTIGLAPISWMLLIELFTPEIRAIASGFAVVSCWTSGLVVTFTAPYFFYFLGRTYTFYFYGLINIMGILFIWFFVPETKLSSNDAINTQSEA